MTTYDDPFPYIDANPAIQRVSKARPDDPDSPRLTGYYADMGVKGGHWEHHKPDADKSKIVKTYMRSDRNTSRRAQQRSGGYEGEDLVEPDPELSNISTTASLVRAMIDSGFTADEIDQYFNRHAKTSGAYWCFRGWTADTYPFEKAIGRTPVVRPVTLLEFPRTKNGKLQWWTKIPFKAPDRWNGPDIPWSVAGVDITCKVSLHRSHTLHVMSTPKEEITPEERLGKQSVYMVHAIMGALSSTPITEGQLKQGLEVLVQGEELFESTLQWAGTTLRALMGVGMVEREKDSYGIWGYTSTVQWQNMSEEERQGWYGQYWDTSRVKFQKLPVAGTASKERVMEIYGKERLEFIPGTVTACSVLTADMHEWVEGLRRWGKANLMKGAQLEEWMGEQDVTKTKRRVNGKVVWVWVGVGLRTAQVEAA